VRIPKFKHEDVTSWFMKKQSRFGGLSARDYLKGRSWEERRAIGLQALIETGVLEP
jgi:hypothetical protein